jgi:hypothetical protein
MNWFARALRGRCRSSEDEMTMRDGGEDLLLQPLGPQELLLLLT